MPRLEVTLRSTEGSASEEVSLDVPDEDWDRLLAFHREVERLRSTRFVQERQGGQIAVNWSVGQPIRSNAKQVDIEAVGAMLLKLRPFVLQDEETFFHKIKKLLKRRLAHKAFRRHIDLLDDGFTLRTLGRKIKFQGQGRTPLSVDVVMDWLNSYEYHRDPKKKEAVEQDLGFFGQDQDGLPVILFALTDMVQSVLDLDGLVETLIEVERGVRSEIHCPPDFLSETE